MTSAEDMNSVSPSVKVADVAMHFAQEYYTILSREPERLHGFYGKASTLVHDVEGEMEAPVFRGIEDIHGKIVSSEFAGSRVIINSIDSQPSLNGAILVVVLGRLNARSGAARRFAQTFVLAEQPNGYYVLNDVLRFFTFEEQAKPAAVSNASVPAALAISAPASGQAKHEVANTLAKQPTKGANERSSWADAPVETESVQAAPQKPQATLQRPTGQPPKSVEPVEEVSSSSSWAKLAAVQQNRWGSGVVSSAKGSSIVQEEESKTRNDAGFHDARRDDRRGSERRGGFRNGQGNRDQRDNQGQGQRDQTEQRPRGPRPERRSREGSSIESSTSVFIGRISGDVDISRLEKAFAALGGLKSFDYVSQRNCAFAEFESAEAAKAVLGKSVTVDGRVYAAEHRRAGRSSAPRHPRPQHD